MYCENPAAVAQELGLLPADEGANVALLSPFDPVVWYGATIDAGARYCAPSQVVLDSLSGNGRMPSEGEALLTWMAENEDAWRLNRLSDDAIIAVPA
jgi:hypothetical protein